MSASWVAPQKQLFRFECLNTGQEHVPFEIVRVVASVFNISCFFLLSERKVGMNVSLLQCLLRSLCWQNKKRFLITASYLLFAGVLQLGMSTTRSKQWTSQLLAHWSPYSQCSWPFEIRIVRCRQCAFAFWAECIACNTAFY